MVVVLAGLFMGCPTLLSPSICYVMLCYVCDLIASLMKPRHGWYNIQVNFSRVMSYMDTFIAILL